MKFDVILTNPPFQDTVKRNRTPHKLWIDFTRAVFDRLLVDDGLLCQVSPASFGSPSNKVLDLMKENRTVCVRFDTGEHFPTVASTFADYLIYKSPQDGSPTTIVESKIAWNIQLDGEISYLPNDVGPHAISIHRKVIFQSANKLSLQRDYVTCHNILLRKSDTLSKTETKRHVHPVFHTNRQIWYSAVRQPWASLRKVMWTRSGYTKPFYDSGLLGGTDMVYFVEVESEKVGVALAHNLNTRLFQYIFKTAKWSGFGNEKVFAALPELPAGEPLSDKQMYRLFDLTPEEVEHVEGTLG